MRASTGILSLSALVTSGCTAELPPEPEPTTLFEAVTVSVVADETDGLRGPRDLDFNPEVENELWIVNRSDDATLTISNAGSAEQSILLRKDPFAMHFMEETSSISFAAGMKFGTCGESRNTYDDQVPLEEANDFMGPVLWSADPDIFAKSNPAAVAEGNGDLGSHLDMMHETPLCMGIAWVDANIYFVFEGLTNTIARYDFKTDHGPGFDYHGDGTVHRFADVDVFRVADVPSHMAYDQASGLLYVADTGNARIGVLDVGPAVETSSFTGFETEVNEFEGATWTDVVAPGAHGLQLPSGLALRDGILYVGDNLTSRISAFDLQGNLIDTLDLEIDEGGLMGLRVSPDGKSLFVVDHVGNRVLRVEGLAVPQ